MKNELGLRIKQKRNSLGLKANYVANELGISASTYSDWENGNLVIRDGNQLIKLAILLRMGLSELITGRSNKDIEADLKSIEDSVRNLRLHHL